LLLFASVASLITWLLHHFSGLSWELAYKDALMSSTLMAAAIWCCRLVVNAYPTRVFIIGYAVCVAAAIGYGTWFVDEWALGWLENSDNALYHIWFGQSLNIRLVVILLVCGWAATYTALYKRIDELDRLFKQQSDAATLLKDAELYKLRQQLHPHFLYNCLNSISALIVIQPDKAQEMLGRLSDFLRSSVKREAQDKISINDELAYIETYVAIETVRFGDRLQVQFQKDYVDDAQIPPFLLQPILENAIKFGLYGKTGTVSISIHIALQESFLAITVTNPYDPQMSAPEGTGFGLEGIRRRLYLLFARTDLLETSQENETFTTRLKIPQTYV
jgi:hypothetical protein